MKQPIVIKIPLKEPRVDAKCTYLDKSGKWTELENPEWQKLSDDKAYMECKSTHLTTFAL